MDSKYPWAHLFTQVNEFSDDSDEEEDLDVSKTLKDVKKELLAKKKQIEDMKSISNETFDTMEKTIESLQDQLKLSRISASALQEIKPVVITQAALAHSANTHHDKQAFTRKILQGVHKWLKQRQKVVRYITQHKILSDEETKTFQSVLYDINKQQLTDLIDQIFQATL